MPKITNELMKTFPGKVLSMHMFATSFTPKVIILLCSIAEAYLGANTNLRKFPFSTQSTSNSMIEISYQMKIFSFNIMDFCLNYTKLAMLGINVGRSKINSPK